ncbi:MAG: hypothetical protein IIY03_03920, partial [Muribaculaceae bacterium]|nr:hypothetical protein [Muribaculaceae bacterium]
DDTASICGKVGRRHPITEASAMRWGFSVSIHTPFPSSRRDAEKRRVFIGLHKKSKAHSS